MGKREQGWPYLVFNIAFGLVFTGIFVLSLLHHDNPFLKMGLFQLFAAFLVLLALILGAVVLWRKYGHAPRHETAVLAALLTAYFVLQLVVGLKLQVGLEDAWDYALVGRAAQDFVLEDVLPGKYFALFSNNVPLFWLYVGYFQLVHFFGVQDFIPALVVLNAVFINAAQLFLYLTARRLFGKKWALPVLIIGMLHPALLLYVPIAYTDTLSLPFVMGAAWLWICARDRHKRKSPSGGFAAGAFALTALGAALKFSAAVLTIAFLLDLLFFWDGKRRLRICVISVVCFVGLWGGIRAAGQTALPTRGVEGIPFTHWIMMGLHGKGGYWDPDYQLTLQYDTYEERAVFTREEIARRIQELGLSGMVRHCLDKVSYIVSDGTCYAPEKLNRGARQPNFLHQFVIAGERYSGALYYAADALQLCLWAFCAIGGFLAAKRDEGGATVFRLAGFGLLLFLLIWEARSRYLVNFLPLYLLCAASAFFPCTGKEEKERP